MNLRASPTTGFDELVAVQNEMSHATLNFSADVVIMTTLAKENQDFISEHFGLTEVDVELLINAIVVMEKELAERYGIDQWLVFKIANAWWRIYISFEDHHKLHGKFLTINIIVLIIIKAYIIHVHDA